VSSCSAIQCTSGCPSSAFETNAQPVALAYDEPTAIAWVGAEPGLRNAATILSRTRPVHLRLRFLPPLAGPALADRKTMAATARAAIERALAL
jgi:1-acyl-sn-glycerol-3-phosphate acyltransferase